MPNGPLGLDRFGRGLHVCSLSLVVWPLGTPTPGRLLWPLLTSAPSRPALLRVALCAWKTIAASFFDTQRAARHGARFLVSRCEPARVMSSSSCTACGADLPRSARELSVHKRRIYRRRRTAGLRCHVPARLDSLGLDYAVSVRRLARLHSGFLQTNPRGPALAVG